MSSIKMGMESVIQLSSIVIASISLIMFGILMVVIKSHPSKNVLVRFGIAIIAVIVNIYLYNDNKEDDNKSTSDKIFKELIPILILIGISAYYLLKVGDISYVIASGKLIREPSTTNKLEGILMFFTRFDKIKNLDIKSPMEMRKSAGKSSTKSDYSKQFSHRSVTSKYQLPKFKRTPIKTIMSKI